MILIKNQNHAETLGGFMSSPVTNKYDAIVGNNNNNNDNSIRKRTGKITENTNKQLVKITKISSNHKVPQPIEQNKKVIPLKKTANKNSNNNNNNINETKKLLEEIIDISNSNLSKEEKKKADALLKLPENEQKKEIKKLITKDNSKKIQELHDIIALQNATINDLKENISEQKKESSLKDKQIEVLKEKNAKNSKNSKQAKAYITTAASALSDLHPNHKVDKPDKKFVRKKFDFIEKSIKGLEDIHKVGENGLDYTDPQLKKYAKNVKTLQEFEKNISNLIQDINNEYNNSNFYDNKSISENFSEIINYIEKLVELTKNKNKLKQKLNTFLNRIQQDILENAEAIVLPEETGRSLEIKFKGHLTKEMYQQFDTTFDEESRKRMALLKNGVISYINSHEKIKTALQKLENIFEDSSNDIKDQKLKKKFLSFHKEVKNLLTESELKLGAIRISNVRFEVIARFIQKIESNVNKLSLSFDKKEKDAKLIKEKDLNISTLLEEYIKCAKGIKILAQESKILYSDTELFFKDIQKVITILEEAQKNPAETYEASKIETKNQLKELGYIIHNNDFSLELQNLHKILTTNMSSALNINGTIYSTNNKMKETLVNFSETNKELEDGVIKLTKKLLEITDQSQANAEEAKIELKLLNLESLRKKFVPMLVTEFEAVINSISSGWIIDRRVDQAEPTAVTEEEKNSLKEHFNSKSDFQYNKICQLQVLFEELVWYTLKERDQLKEYITKTQSLTTLNKREEAAIAHHFKIPLNNVTKTITTSTKYDKKQEKILHTNEQNLKKLADSTVEIKYEANRTYHGINNNGYAARKVFNTIGSNNPDLKDLLSIDKIVQKYEAEKKNSKEKEEVNNNNNEKSSYSLWPFS